MSLPIRTIAPDEVTAFELNAGTAFGFIPTAEGIESVSRFLELDRTFACYDEDQIVGTAGNLTMELSLPGGTTTPVAGITEVAVRPTHRRRGLLTAMMGRLLEDARAREEALAALWASESLIYGRFGFGVASEIESWQTDRRHAHFRDAHQAPGRVRLVDGDTARARAPGAWDAARRHRPGMTARDDRFWNERFEDQEWRRGGATRFFFALYEEDGRTDGYALYRIKDSWPENVIANEVIVTELVAATRAAHAALWGFVLDLDLTATVTARMQAVDDPLALMFADPRRLSRTRLDGIWLRLIDVPAALEARRYAAAGELVIEVQDALLPDAGGRFALEAAPDGAACRRTEAAPDLVLPIASLGAAYLGGTRFSLLALANRAEERTPGALARADALFATARAPWCPQFF